MNGRSIGVSLPAISIGDEVGFSRVLSILGVLLLLDCVEPTSLPKADNAFILTVFIFYTNEFATIQWRFPYTRIRIYQMLRDLILLSYKQQDERRKRYKSPVIAQHLHSSTSNREPSFKMLPKISKTFIIPAVLAFSAYAATTFAATTFSQVYYGAARLYAYQHFVGNGYIANIVEDCNVKEGDTKLKYI
ncbi:hypothetical protein BDV36DRAFT_248689 [Aspergillus pseudocaelatus]|uniref:Uncharacterized protein n=1 Tax=Aspergillus pseudocaelatus TaxID=1825620 RepID=A0ABQ6WUQ3_9EURO|nr:hypothetical protein BDV36DRAFT_248689 [Aspergillus pseudocaelatus]